MTRSEPFGPDPHSSALEALMDDPSIIGVDGVRRVEREVLLYGQSWHPITDVDLLYHTDSGYVIVQLKTTSRKRWGKAMEQLVKSREYVRQRYGEEPTCYYVRERNGELTAVRSADLDRFEPGVSNPSSRSLSDLMNKQIEDWKRAKLPLNISLYTG